MATQSVKDLEVSQLRSHKSNVRTELGDVSELAESIKSKGILQPLVVRPHPQLDGDFEVIMGHRRLAGAKEAGLIKVPCIVREDITSDADVIESMLVENVHRAGITKSEEGKAYQALLDLGLSTNQVAKKVGRKHETVDSRVKLTALSERTKQKVDNGKATLERAMKIAEFQDYPELQKPLEDNIDNFNFDWYYRESQQKKHWEEWSDKAFENLKSLGWQFLTVEESRLPGWQRIIDTELLEAFPSDPEKVAALTAEDMPDEVLQDEGSQKHAALLAHGMRQVQFYRAIDGEKSKESTPTAEEVAEQEAREKTETALRISRATFVDHMEKMLQTPKKLKGSAAEFLGYCMSREGYKALEYSNILGVPIPENIESPEKTNWIWDRFAEMEVEQLALALFMHQLGFSSTMNQRAQIEFSLDQGFNPHHWRFSESDTRRRLAVDWLGWEETEGERLARDFWEPKLQDTDSDDSEVNF